MNTGNARYPECAFLASSRCHLERESAVMLPSGEILVRTRDVDEAISRVAEVYTPHVLKVRGCGGNFGAYLHASPNLGFRSVELAYGVPVEVDAGDFESFYLMTTALRGQGTLNHGGRAEWRPGHTIPISPTLPTHLYFDRDFHQFTLRIEKDSLERTCSRWLGHSLDRPLVFAAVPFAPALENLWQGVLRSLAPSPGALPPMVAAAFEDYVLALVLQAHRHNFSAALMQPSPLPSRRSIRSAESYMRANLGLPISIGDIAKAAGVSIRGLQAGFRDVHGTTPMRYLRRMRLERTRTDLVEADHASASVTDVALRWGFSHLGRFSSAYRSAFGEYPGDTLRKRRSASRRS